MGSSPQRWCCAHSYVEDNNFSWLVKIQMISRDTYSLFNWGKNYENFLHVCQDLDINMKKLTNFQMTRFADSVRFIFMNLRDDYLAVCQFLLNAVASKDSSSNSLDRGNAEKANIIF